MLPRLLITPGEPAGIGPDLLVMLAQQWPDGMCVAAVADPALIQERARLLQLPIRIIDLSSQVLPETPRNGEIPVIPVPLDYSVIPGELNPASAAYVLATLREACDAVLKQRFDALVTGPVHKSIINDAGFSFSGHTEFLAEHCQRDLTVMMLATPGLRVALVTTHLALAEVPRAITPARLEAITRILHDELQTKFGLANPAIVVSGLNPHAGESGHLGREEIEIITPTLDKLRSEGMNLLGPLPADTLFTPKYLDHADAVLAMYHDQGLPVLKYKGFGDACNITLGLPIIRSSVDHGTALDLAGTGQVDIGSLINALNTAAQMARCRGDYHDR